MINQVVQDIQYATPLLVVAASEVSDDCLQAMKELCNCQFTISSKNFPNLVSACGKYNVEVPNSIIVQPIYCRSINDLIQFQKTLDKEKYHTFLKWYCTIAFIDYSVNKNVDETRKNFLNCTEIKSDRSTFVIYQSEESLFRYHSETTCVCFDNFSVSVAISCIQDFIARAIASTAIKLLNYGFNEMKIEPKTVRDAKVKADFAGLSNNTTDFLQIVKGALKELEGTTNYALLGSFYEIIGLMELRNPDFTHTHKIVPSSNQLPAFNWFPSFSQKALQLFVVSANYFNRANYYGNCIDCGIRIIIYGYTEVIQSIAYYINHHAKEEAVIQKSWDLINVVNRLKMKRKAALLASQFSKSFNQTDTSNTYSIFALKIILKESDSSSLVQVRDLCIPIIMTLLDEKEKVPMEEYSKFLSITMSTIGPSLSADHQTHLFNELEAHSCRKINLPLHLQKIETDKLSYQITKRDINKKSGSSVFLYSYLSTTDNYIEFTVDINHSITISAHFFNPFSIVLKAENVHLIADNSSLCDYSTQYFQPNSENKIPCHITPQKVGECTIKGISMTFFGAKQTFLLKEPIILSVVGNVPNFHLRTDLPLSSNMTLYDGEIHEFTIWVTNLGEVPISELEVNFLQPEIARVIEAPKLPILPHSMSKLICALTALKGEELLAAKVVASCADSEYCCCQNIRQKLIIEDSLEICRIYLMTAHPRGEKSCDKVFIGFEVRNNAPCSFMYKSNLCGSESSGLIGKDESLMMVGTYKPSELISNGSDANKAKLIATTKIKEAQIGRSLSLAQRLRVAMCVSMLQRIMDRWKFEWTVSSIRRGELITKQTAVDDDFFNGIESRQIQAKIDWKNDGDKQIVDKIFIDNKYLLTVSFDKEMYMCGLEFPNDEDEEDDYQNGSILWEGELNQKVGKGKSTFDFVLCFGAAKMVKFFINYTSVTGIEGQTLITVNVNNS